MGIRFYNPVVLWFFLSLVPLTLLYIYLTRRESKVVPSLQIWQSARPADRLFINRPLKRFLEWLLATCFVISLVLLAAGIHGVSSTDADQLIVFVDNSSSMTRSDEDTQASTFLRRSINKVNQDLRNLSDDTRWRIYQLAPSPRLTDRGTGSVNEPHLGQLSGAPLEASETRLQRFLNTVLTNSALSDRDVRSYLYTDRQLPGLPGLLQQHAELQIIPVGGPAGNVAITDASLERRWNGEPSSLHLDLRNYSNSANTFPIRLHGMTKQNRQTTMSPGESKQIQIPLDPRQNPPDRLGAVMDTTEPFPTDNGAYFNRRIQQPVPVQINLTAPSSRFVRSVIVSSGPPFTVEAADTERNRQSHGRDRPPIRLLEQPPDAPSEPGSISFLTASTEENLQTAQQPISTVGSSSLTSGLDFQELTIQKYLPLQPNKDETCLLSSGDHCLALLGPSDGTRPYVRFGFALSDSNITLLPEFPVLMHRMLNVLRNGGHSSNSKRILSRTDELNVDPDTPLIRTWLRPDGGLAEQQFNRPGPSSHNLPPGWYQPANEQENRATMRVNFFHPEESNMNRTSPTVEQRISTSSPPSSHGSPSSFPIRTIMLLFALFTWTGFLVLSTY